MSCFHKFRDKETGQAYFEQCSETAKANVDAVAKAVGIEGQEGVFMLANILADLATREGICSSCLTKVFSNCLEVVQEMEKRAAIRTIIRLLGIPEEDVAGVEVKVVRMDNLIEESEEFGSPEPEGKVH
jgi:hypothetical protein